MRVDGQIIPLPLSEANRRNLPAFDCSLLTDTQKQHFESVNELDISFGIKAIGRVRMNVFSPTVSHRRCAEGNSAENSGARRTGTATGDVRHDENSEGFDFGYRPNGIWKIDDTRVDDRSFERTQSEKGVRIMTVEDPIEFVHSHKKSLVNQREVGSDTTSFGQALKYVLRQDPDIILVGEMRDIETIQAAINIAETGHLVLATLHTTDAAQSINRIIDVFPPHQQSQVRAQVSFVLQAVISQQLLPRLNGVGRVMAAEILIVTPAIRNLIREVKTEQIIIAMRRQELNIGMQTMNMALYDLYVRHVISFQEALSASTDPDDLKRLLQRSGGSERVS